MLTAYERPMANNDGFPTLPTDPMCQQITHLKLYSPSRFACPTCEQRGIKCDETLPICRNCAMMGTVRCGYLDFTPAQLEMIRFEHVKAEIQNDRSSLLLQEPTFNPGPIEVVYKPLPKRRIRPSRAKSATSKTNSSTPIVKSQRSTPLSTSNEITLISHSYTLPLQIEFPIYFSKAQSDLDFRCDTISLSCMSHQVICATKDLITFHGVLLLGTGVLLAKLSFLKEMYLKFRGDCVNLLLKHLVELNDDNASDLWCLSMTLDASTVYFKTENSFKTYSKLTIGPSSILETIYKTPSKFPKSFKRIKFYADSLLNTTKCLTISSYDYKILFEFKEIAIDFGRELFIQINSNKKFINDSINLKLKKQWSDMIEIIDFAIEIFTNYSDSKENTVLKYSLTKLYELFQKWFSAYPSECSMVDDSKMSAIEKVFYVLWLTLLKELEAITVSATYIFTFFLHGYFFRHPFKKQDILEFLKNNGDEKLIWCYNYCARIISFLDRRMVYVLTTPISSESPPQLLDSDIVNVFRIHENCIINFKDTVINKFNYPVKLSKNIDEYMETLQEVLNCSESLEETLYINTPEKPIVKNEVDLLNNVNPKTLMLNNDFDPRFIDKETFETSHILPVADLEFISRYIKDRKLLVQMAENEKLNQKNQQQS